MNSVSVLNQKKRKNLQKSLKALIKYFGRRQVPDAVGMMLQGLQDEISTVAAIEDKALIAYRVQGNRIKVMSLGSRQAGLGTALVRWLESRFIHKDEIVLWASPNARGFYEKLGFERHCNLGDYRKRLVMTNRLVT